MTTFLFVRHGEPDYDSVGSWRRFPFGKDYAGLTELCKEHDKYGGIYPDEVPRKWESTEMVRRRVWQCLEKYRNCSCVVVSGHAMMMQAALGIDRAIEYGEILSASCFV